MGHMEPDENPLPTSISGEPELEMNNEENETSDTKIQTNPATKILKKILPAIMPYL